MVRPPASPAVSPLDGQVEGIGHGFSLAPVMSDGDGNYTATCLCGSGRNAGSAELARQLVLDHAFEANRPFTAARRPEGHVVEPVAVTFDVEPAQQVADRPAVAESGGGRAAAPGDEPGGAEPPVRPVAGGQAGLLYDAWCLIANAGLHQGGWASEHPDWVEAAERWRDRWHETLPGGAVPAEPGLPEPGVAEPASTPPDEPDGDEMRTAGWEMHLVGGRTVIDGAGVEHGPGTKTAVPTPDGQTVGYACRCGRVFESRLADGAAEAALRLLAAHLDECEVKA